MFNTHLGVLNMSYSDDTFSEIILKLVLYSDLRIRSKSLGTSGPYNDQDAEFMYEVGSPWLWMDSMVQRWSPSLSPVINGAVPYSIHKTCFFNITFEDKLLVINSAKLFFDICLFYLGRNNQGLATLGSGVLHALCLN